MKTVMRAIAVLIVLASLSFGQTGGGTTTGGGQGAAAFGSIQTNTILDANGNPFILSTGTPSAVDSITITNAAAANPATVIIGATGTDTNIHLEHLPKGNGANLFNAGTAANPSIGFVGATTTGFHLFSTLGVVFDQAGTAELCLGCQTNIGGTNQGGLNSAAANPIGWSSTGDPTATSDTLFGRGGAAATFAFGGNTAAAPTDQTVRSITSRGGTDTNTAGSQLSILAGAGTGTASPKMLLFKGDNFGTGSGTTIHPAVTRHAIEGSATLTSGAAKTIISAPLATKTGQGGHVYYSIEGINSTDICVTSGDIAYAAVNKAGVFTNTVSAIGDASTACTTGTLTVTWAWTGANPDLLQATATLSLGSPTSFKMVYEVSNTTGGNGDITITADGT